VEGDEVHRDDELLKKESRMMYVRTRTPHQHQARWRALGKASPSGLRYAARMAAIPVRGSTAPASARRHDAPQFSIVGHPPSAGAPQQRSSTAAARAKRPIWPTYIYELESQRSVATPPIGLPTSRLFSPRQPSPRQLSPRLAAIGGYPKTGQTPLPRVKAPRGRGTRGPLTFEGIYLFWKK